jgi:PAS domain S-box-containing protein
MSIRTKLIIIFLAIALIPLFFISVLTFNNYSKSLEADRLANLGNIAAFKADKIETYFAGLKTDIEIVQHSYIIKKYFPTLIQLAQDPTDPEFTATRKMLDKSMLREMPGFLGLSAIMLVNNEAGIVYSSSQNQLPKDFINGLPAAGQKALQEGRRGFYISDIFFSRTKDNAPMMLITAPAFDLADNFIAVIVFEVDMVPIYKLIQDTAGLGHTGETLVGKKFANEILYLNQLRHDPKAALNRRVTIGSVRSTPIQNAVQGQNGVGRGIDYRGKPVIAAWRYIPSLGWGVVAKIDTEEAFADIVNLRDLIIIILAIISVLSCIMAISFAQSISKPIQKLSKGAEIIGSGNLDYKVGTDLKDEIGHLSRAFDKMTAEQKQAQERLLATSQYARSLLEASLDPLVTISADGKITDVNEATSKVTGLARQELIGTDFSDYFTEPEKAQAGYQQVFAQGFVIDYPLTIRHKDGKLTDVLYNASIYKDVHGNVLGVFAAARDVTALKQAFQYARSLLEASLDPLVTISADGKITDVNEATIRATGRTREELIGTDFSGYFTEPEKAQAGYQQVFAQGFVTDYPLTVRHKDGELMDVLYNASVYKDLRGNVLGVFAAARDVTALKQAEAELRHHRDSLEVLVQERTAKLEILNTELARSNESLEQFAYVASHDLQEPLRVMSSYSQLLERRYKKKLDQDADDFIDFIVDAASRMQRLITDLLAYSRVGRKDLPITKVDLNEVVRKVIFGLSSSIESSGGKVTYDELPVLMSHEMGIMQVFQNLISNALKFHGEKSPQVRISAKKDKNAWVFSVADNGLGIESQYHERIFQIFQRLHSREEYSGTGIGLSICKKIVSNLGGKIWVESEPGKGSTFHFTIPI